MCLNKIIAESQRKDEIERGDGTAGTMGFEAKGCYECNGKDDYCSTYLTEDTIKQASAQMISFEDTAPNIKFDNEPDTPLTNAYHKLQDKLVEGSGEEITKLECEGGDDGVCHKSNLGYAGKHSTLTDIFDTAKIECDKLGCSFYNVDKVSNGGTKYQAGCKK